MPKFDIWMEGFCTNGSKGTASYEGTFEANTFEEACEKWADTLSDRSLFKSSPHPNFWGCALYDNEQDARKSFG